MSQNDGGPAFPFGQVSEQTGRPINGYHNDGMSLLDWFAGQALITAMSWDHKEDATARMAYDQAEAMLRERERRMKQD